MWPSDIPLTTASFISSGIKRFWLTAERIVRSSDGVCRAVCTRATLEEEPACPSIGGPRWAWRRHGTHRVHVSATQHGADVGPNVWACSTSSYGTRATCRGPLYLPIPAAKVNGVSLGETPKAIFE